jgi:superfamily II DNA/RNA helicase
LSFNQFRLRSDILKGLQDTKIESPNSLQKKIYKAVQTGNDLVINTAVNDRPEVGYLISLLNQIAQSDRRQGTRAVILTGDKTRAKQLDEWIWAIGYHASIESACITDDGNPEEQKKAISAGPVIVVATPTRFSELLEETRMIFREVEQLIVDQAESVKDWESVDAISKRIISKCQRIFTASKDSKELREAEKSMLEDPELVTIAKKESSATGSKKTADAQSAAEKPAITKDLTQYYINVPPRSKISTLMAHLNNNQADTVVIFTASRRTADRLYKIFRKSNKRAVSIHDEIDEDTFKERFDRFTSGNVQHLIVGEMSAAKIPLEHATQVINYDVPEEVEEYRLRADLVGTGKANKILSLVSKQDRSDIQTICKSLGYAPEEVPLPVDVKGGGSKSKSAAKKSQGSKQNGKPKKGGRGQKKQKRGAKGKRGPNLDALPRPTFDQLEGGRSGKKKEKKGIVGFIKKLFS